MHFHVFTFLLLEVFSSPIGSIPLLFVRGTVFSWFDYMFIEVKRTSASFVALIDSRRFLLLFKVPCSVKSPAKVIISLLGLFMAPFICTANGCWCKLKRKGLEGSFCFSPARYSMMR